MQPTDSVKCFKLAGERTPGRVFRRAIALTALGLLLTPLHGDSTAIVSEPVGYVTLNVPEPGVHFRSVGMLRPVEFRSTIDSIKADERLVGDDSADWESGAFNDFDDAPSHFLEILHGDYEGLQIDIVDTLGDSGELKLAVEPPEGLEPGTQYAVRPHWTLAALFGEENEAGLRGGLLPEADEILVRDSEQQRYLTYYYKDDAEAIGGTGWRASDDLFRDAANDVLYPDEGLAIRRKDPEADQVGHVVTGDVKTGKAMLFVLPGLNIIANPYPVDIPEPDELRLLEGDNGELRGGANPEEADWVYLMVEGELTPVYFNTTTNAWLRVDNDSALDLQEAPALAGQGALLVQRRDERPAFLWRLLPPF